VAAHPLLRAISSLTGGRPLAQSITPRLTFDDVILPQATRRALEQALAHVRRHDLIFRVWGLGERHPTGLALVFNFAGPPGTGKTICAEALAHALGRRLLVVRYAEVESMWFGQTPKNVTELFRTARDENAVLLFDEADSITGRRSTSPDLGVLREMNAVVNVLLNELDSFRGVVIFATNLAANFDPAFERRMRTQVRFEVPTATEREQIWRVQMHPRLTPLHEDVDFRSLARQYEATGGDIRNAVLKAATTAALEPGDDASRTIRQAHLEAGIRDVLAGKRVMQQSLFTDRAQSAALASLTRLPSLTAGAAWALPVSVAAFVIALIALIAALIR
jgi:SpoVK/Ycf46/Vps4 family AAA+-type ATPase